MSYRLLVIEDSPSTRTFLQEMLRGLGYAVVGEAIDADEGLHLAQSLQPDLIFLAVDLKDDEPYDAIRDSLVETNARLRRMAPKRHQLTDIFRSEES